jgi:excisionase family DNA binding protein
MAADAQTGDRGGPGASPAEDRSVGVAEAATMLGCDPATVRRMVRAGVLPAHRVGVRGRGVRITVRAIEAHRERGAGIVRPAVAVRPPSAAAANTASHRAALATLREMGLLN